MREIKFRAWDGRRMVVPSSVAHGKARAIKPCDSEDRVMTDEDGSNYYCNWDIEVSKDWPLMQYTGIKDSAGVEIYEGDIVTWGFGNAVISFGEWSVEDDYDSTGFGWIAEDCWLNSQCKVVGNIHQNPELIGNSVATKTTTTE